ncbi:MAG: acyl-CoA dehydrogenase family protein [Acidimicrobiia bacterium]
MAAPELQLRQADYSLGEDHEALRDAFASFFANECPIELVRENEPRGFDEKLWRKVVDMRAVAMGVDEAAGGDGAGLTEMVLVTEPLGQRVAPVPLIDTVIAARLLARVAPAHVAGVIDGDRIVTLSLLPVRAGEPQLVSSGAIADAVIALVGDDLVLATSSAPIVAPANQGHAPLGWWDFAAPSVAREVLASGAEARTAYDEAVREWKLLMASALVGMAQATLDIAVEHAKSRIAFGVPIGTFQAVAHPLVDLAMSIESTRRVVRKAAWFADNEHTEERQLVPLAYYMACETGIEGGIKGVHALGGVGFTVESDQQLYFRRAKGWTLVAGDSKNELDAIADLLYGPAKEQS